MCDRTERPLTRPTVAVFRVAFDGQCFKIFCDQRVCLTEGQAVRIDS